MHKLLIPILCMASAHMHAYDITVTNHTNGIVTIISAVTEAPNNTFFLMPHTYHTWPIKLRAKFVVEFIYPDKTGGRVTASMSRDSSYEIRGSESTGYNWYD